ncbi:metallothiol transferase FosB [Macrococcus capreoli]|uniref:metallothiol transferase FosB n=1 Tax=Macrococcus capreoli TaxID=2982690 RepID=UPI0021D6139D|nr:metallothiol transferase FosB [Macrococcus sp. TMW 2.2395]MCU7558192.1 metallothiol transferase FosB [Macrococcus sp. TMW 2.2395]
MINAINHITFSVANLERSIYFYQNILEGKLLMKGRTSAYLDIGGMWIALNVETDVQRFEINPTYTHIAFSIDEQDFSYWMEKFEKENVNLLESRARSKEDKLSIYFTDPDGHRLELHTGTLEDRLQYYKEQKPHIKIY